MVWLWTGLSVMGTTLNMMVPWDRACWLVVRDKEWTNEQTGNNKRRT